MGIMRKFFLTIVVAIVAASVATAVAQTQTPAKPAPVNVTGKWSMSLETDAFTATPTLELKQDGEKLTGTYIGRYCECKFEGKVKDRTLEFAFTMNAEGTDVRMQFSGEVSPDGEAIRGKASLAEIGDATWSAKRIKS
jgi:hypothetical protein